MKLLFAINNLCAGGAEGVLSALVNQISTYDGIEVHLVCFHSKDSFAYFYRVNEVVPIHLIEYKNDRQLVNVIESIKPNTIVSFLNPMNSVCSIASKATGVAHIACERNNPFRSPYRTVDRDMRDDAFLNASGCVFQTIEAANYYGDRLKGEYTIINNPICLRLYPEIPKVLFNENRIVSVGRYAEQKNYLFMLDVFKIFHEKHPDFVLECYGKDSGEYNRIKQYALDNGLEDCVIMNQETPFVHNYIQSAKAFLFTSLFEGSPNAIMEAAALKIPCIASDIPEIRSLNSPYTFCKLCSLDDIGHFVDALEQIIYDKAKSTPLILNGLKMARERDIRIIADDWVKFISMVIMNFGKARK